MFNLKSATSKAQIIFLISIFTCLTLVADHKVRGEIDGPDTDGPLRAYVNHSVSGAWMTGYLEGAVSGQILYIWL